VDRFFIRASRYVHDGFRPQGADDFYVDIAGAVPVFHQLGFIDVTERCVRRYADEGKLPFFRGIGRRRMIEVNEQIPPLLP
jgi:hypothetical protein